MHRLRNVLQRQHVVTAKPGDSVYDVVVTMTRARVGAIVIAEDDHMVGVFSERDLMTRVVVPRCDPAQTPVREVMTTRVVTATPEDHVDYCVQKMKSVGCRHLPVVVNGRVIAMLSMRDLLSDELEEQNDEIRNLRAYLHQAPLS